MKFFFSKAYTMELWEYSSSLNFTIWLTDWFIRYKVEWGPACCEHRKTWILFYLFFFSSCCFVEQFWTSLQSEYYTNQLLNKDFTESRSGLICEARRVSLYGSFLKDTDGESMNCGNRIMGLLLTISFNAICFISFSRSSFFSEFLVKERLNVTATSVLGNSRGDIRLVAGLSDVKSECFWSEQVVYERYEKSVAFYSDFHLRISKCSINITWSSLTTSLWGDHFVIEGSGFYGSKVCWWLWNPICDPHNLPQVEQMYCCCVWK